MDLLLSWRNLPTTQLRRESTTSEFILTFLRAIQRKPKSVGKSMKPAHHHKIDKEVALKHLLISYRSTLHPATGVSPGATMLRNGYKTEFPHQVLSDESVQAAFNLDQALKLERSDAINASRHRI